MDQFNGHILVIASPLQGHVSPLLKLSHQLTKLGAMVTFLTTDATRVRIMSGPGANAQGIRMMSIPDCMEHKDDWKDQEKVFAGIQQVLPGFLEDLLNKSDGDKINGVIVDTPMAWVLGFAKKFGVKVALFWAGAVGCLALGLKIPELVDSKFIDSDGTPMKNETIPLLPDMRAVEPSHFTWYFPEDKKTQKAIFHATKGIIDHMKDADWILCNCFLELEPAILTVAPNFLSVGPLLANGQLNGSLCSEDPSCLSWLDKHPKGSVVYVAFGSTSRFNRNQLDEVALGLELTGLPFLWVASSGGTLDEMPLAFTKEYAERMADRAKIVKWAPQEAVLAHPSVSCFLSHCGWSSVMESLSMGVPLLCWPYFGDQMHTSACICDSWRVGTRLSPDEDGGIVSRFQVKKKVEELMCDADAGGVRENVWRMKEIATKSLAKGGSSSANLEYLLHQINGIS